MPEKTSHPDTALPKCRSRTDEAVRPLSFSNISRLVGEYVFGSGSSSVASTVGDPRVDGITKTPDMSPDSQTDSPVDPFFKPRPFLSRQMSGIKWKNNRFSRLASLHTNTGDGLFSFFCCSGWMLTCV